MRQCGKVEDGVRAWMFWGRDELALSGYCLEWVGGRREGNKLACLFSDIELVDEKEMRLGPDSAMKQVMD